MIRKFQGFERMESNAARRAPEKGGYIMAIKKASVHDNSRGQYLKIAADIAEGEFRDYFLEEYSRQKLEPKKWHCLYLVNVPNGDQTSADEISRIKFQKFIHALESSNAGYRFDWDEAKFAGLRMGGVFNKREYERKDGTIGWALNLAYVCPIGLIKSGSFFLPEDKKLPKMVDQLGAREFMSLPEMPLD